MILQALTKYYDRLSEEGTVAAEGFKRVEIPFLVLLKESGDFVDLQDTRTKSGNRMIARSFMVPQERGRAGSKSWQTSNLLWDHYGYVFGWPKSDSDEHREMAFKQHSAFVAEVKKLQEKFPSDPEINAVRRFLESGNFSTVFENLHWSECKKIPGCNLTFKIDGYPGLVCENTSVKNYISASLVSGLEDEDETFLPAVEGICLVTGERAPVARLHPRTPILGAKSNAKIVSFQKNMGFDSYGRLQSYNAPTSKKAAFAYTTALNEMLSKSSRQRIIVGDASTVFWAEKKHKIESVFSDLFGELPQSEPEQDYKQIVATFRAPQTGVPPQLDPKTRFFVLGLAPNAARIAIRFWYAGTAGEVVGAMEQHFDDIEIVRPLKQPRYLSLFRLLVATAAQGKAENIPPNLAGEFMKAILLGVPYPQALLSAAIRRCRAEREINYPRASLIKALLAREARYYKKTEKEVGMSLDTTNSNIGYRLGRLFATLEKIQEEAIPGINATIRDRFYGSASATPVSAFPHLMKLKNHHLAKLENRGRAVNFERTIGEIMEDLKDFPPHLNLPDQGRFAVGYYHQRQVFFTSSKKDQQS